MYAMPSWTGGRNQQLKRGRDDDTWRDNKESQQDEKIVKLMKTSDTVRFQDVQRGTCLPWHDTSEPWWCTGQQSSLWQPDDASEQARYSSGAPSYERQTRQALVDLIDTKHWRGELMTKTQTRFMPYVYK